MLPYNLMRTRKAEFKKHLGKLSLHGPHHDHYQNVPLNAINTWISLGRVHPENGMFIFPGVWGRNLPRGAEVVRADQYLGEPIAIEMAPGDALLFHSNHMHSSVLNTTDETRAVLTNRICLEPPLYPHPDRPHRYFHSDAFSVDPPGAQAFAEPGFVGREDRVLEALPANGSAAAPFFEFPVETQAMKERAAYANPARDAPEGEIVILDKSSCGVRIGGEFLTFRRYCTHEGADLSLGFVKNGKVVCPFHGVQFCPQTGKPNCDALRDISM
jgi:nitrite reductase/ring-hydroxylating ferredoxin subunit